MRDMAKLVRFSLAFLLISTSGAVAIARQQTSAVADAARKAREKNPPAASTQKVWTNENIPQTPGAPVSVVGTAANSPSPATDNPNASAGAAPAVSGTPSNNEAKVKALRTQLADAKEQLQSSRTDLDILTRKRALDSQSYYGKPDYSSDKAGAAQLDDEQAQIDAKKTEVDDLQSKINDIQAQIDALAATGNSNSNSAPTPADSGTSPTNPPAPPEPTRNTPGL